MAKPARARVRASVAMIRIAFCCRRFFILVSWELRFLEMSGDQARRFRAACNLAREQLPGTALTLAERRVGVNALRLTQRAHVVHALNGLFADKCEDISRGKTGT